MTTRLKTVEYSFPLLSTLADFTETSIGPITVILPETGKVFKSVIAKVSADEASGNAGSVLNRKANFALDAAAAVGVNHTQDLPHTAESISVNVFVDLTAHFTTNFTGTSHSLSGSVMLDTGASTTPGWRNVSVTLQVTYEFDDTSATHLKTVHIPLTSPLGAIATTDTAIDTIPALDTFCPEAGKVFRDAFLLVEGNTTNTTTTDTTLTVSVGGVAQTGFFHEAAMGTARTVRNLNKLAANDGTGLTFSTAAAQAVSATSAGSAEYNHICFTLVVTYEFNPATTTTVLNSLLLPHNATPTPMDSAGEGHGFEFFIEEPSPVIAKSAMRLSHEIASTGTTTFLIKIGGAATSKDYVHGDANPVVGSILMQCGFESEISLVRGKNLLQYQVDHNAASNYGYGFAMSSLWILNYTSGVHADGIWAHNHTVRTGAMLVEGLSATIASTWNLSVPEAAVFYTRPGFFLHWCSATSAQSVSGLTVDVEESTSESGLLQRRFRSAYAATMITAPEQGWHYTYFCNEDRFQRWTGDPHPDRLDPEVARLWRVWINAAATAAQIWLLECYLTYHSMTYAVAGTITGLEGDGTGLTATVHDAVTGEALLALPTTAGTFNGTWFDDTRQVYVEVQESATKVGRSANTVAT